MVRCSTLNVSLFQRLVQQFQVDAETRVAILSIKAAGVVRYFPFKYFIFAMGIFVCKLNCTDALDCARTGVLTRLLQKSRTLFIILLVKSLNSNSLHLQCLLLSHTIFMTNENASGVVKRPPVVGQKGRVL